MSENQIAWRPFVKQAAIRTTDRLARIMKRHALLLREAVAEDKALSALGDRLATHAFLARSTQALYIRQVNYLCALLTEHLGKRPEFLRVLDWGCGKGHISYLLRSHGFDVTGCDLARSMDDSAFGQQTPILDDCAIPVVPLHDATTLPFTDETFDCVVSFGVLEHVQSDSDSLSEIYRVLRPGGILFVTFLPYYLSWTQLVWRLRGVGYHDRLYSISRIRDLSRRAGFHLAGARLAQFFPKNSVALRIDQPLEVLDRCLCAFTPLKYFATNLEIVLLRSS